MDIYLCIIRSKFTRDKRIKIAIFRNSYYRQWTPNSFAVVKRYDHVFSITPTHGIRYIRSLCMTIKWDAKGGKSGATFSKTADERFVVKFITKTELQMFLDCALKYVQTFSFVSVLVFVRLCLNTINVRFSVFWCLKFAAYTWSSIFQLEWLHVQSVISRGARLRFQTVLHRRSSRSPGICFFFHEQTLPLNNPTRAVSRKPALEGIAPIEIRRVPYVGLLELHVSGS